MAEKIVSPGVFTRENDQSFVAQGVADLGAVVIGPTTKGPAYVPTVIRNGYNEFIIKFGQGTSNTYVPYAVQDYLSKASSVTIVRVLDDIIRSFDCVVKLGNPLGVLKTQMSKLPE